MAGQQQFLNVIDRDEAERRFRERISLRPLAIETIGLDDVWGRVLAEDVIASVDVPSFDRSNFDGFAVQAADTYHATEENPQVVRLLREVVSTGVVPESEIEPGTAVGIATGGMLPRGADSIVMVEYTEIVDGQLQIHRAVTPGFGVAYAGTDISASETVLRRGDTITSRESGVLAAIGHVDVRVWKQPVVGIMSTGDEITAPGTPMVPGMVYDSNARILADAVRELGATPLTLGIVRDDLQRIRDLMTSAIEQCDVVLLSGGTSKGEGDLSYHVVDELCEIIAHGVALKTRQTHLPGRARYETGRYSARVPDVGNFHVSRIRARR